MTVHELLAQQARDLLTELAKATPGSDLHDPTVPGGVPNVSGGGGYDTVDHAGWRKQLFAELNAILDRLHKMGWVLDQDGNLKRRHGITIGRAQTY